MDFRTQKERIMPGGDRTGPFGIGPMSGKGMGWCRGRAGAPIGAAQGATGSLGAGRGFGRGRMRFQEGTSFPGRGRGSGLCWTAPAAPAVQPPETEIAYLTAYASDLEASLNAVKSRLEALKGSQGADPGTNG